MDKKFKMFFCIGLVFCCCLPIIHSNINEGYNATEKVLRQSLRGNEADATKVPSGSQQDKAVVVTIPRLKEIVNLTAENQSDSFPINSSLLIEEIKREEHSESEFPQDLFTKAERKKGALLLHIILAVYCFVIIATVCTNYFMPTIQCICQVLQVSDDVAAATFMSIATSSPELFSNIIGTFITKSDIGVGHVLGNAYYDMFFVASLGGLAASQEILLDWWPITRDCSIYLIVSITLTVVVWDGQVESWECAILLSLYVLYFVIMFKNRKIIRLLRDKFGVNVTDPVEVKFDLQKAVSEVHNLKDKTDSILPIEKGREGSEHTQSSIIKNENDDDLVGYTIAPHIVPASATAERKLPLERLTTNRLEKILRMIAKWLVYPVRILLMCTIPDVRRKTFRHFYPVSFVLCIVWIGISTYLGTWMISVIGETIGIPDIVMGMVFMAAGGSVVEAYGVYYKTRRGECSIGLSNSMGCNTLDITMCLALPWLIKSLLPLISTGKTAVIYLDSDMVYINCSLLIVSVLFIYTMLYINKFKLNKRLGIFSGLSYIAVLAIAITVESYQPTNS